MNASNMIDSKPFARFFNASPRNMRPHRLSKADLTSRKVRKGFQNDFADFA